MDQRTALIYGTRKLSALPDIPTQIATPVVWIDPEVISMSLGVQQPTFNDRMGNSWAVPTFGGGAIAYSFWQIPNGMNTRNCLRACGPQDTNAGVSAGISCMGTSVSLGDDITAFFVLRPLTQLPCNQDGTVAMFARHQTSVADGTDNFFWHWGTDGRFFLNRVDTGQVQTAIYTETPGGTVVFTSQSTQARNEVWLNGTVGSNADPDNTALTNPRVLYLGCYPTSPFTYYIHADFGDVIIYNSILSSGDRNIVEKYLGRKWGVAIA